MLLDVVLGQDTALGYPSLQLTVYSERRRKLAFQSSDKSRTRYTVYQVWVPGELDYWGSQIYQ